MQTYDRKWTRRWSAGLRKDAGREARRERENRRHEHIVREASDQEQIHLIPGANFLDQGQPATARLKTDRIIPGRGST